jgi:hypothetical protein
MSASLDRRIAKLEVVGPNREFLSLVLWFLRERGYEELVKIAQGEIPRFLLLAVDDTDILDLEEFRGLVAGRGHPGGLQLLSRLCLFTRQGSAHQGAGGSNRWAGQCDARLCVAGQWLYRGA